MLGSSRFSDVTFHAGQFEVLDQWGLSESGGIIGNDFLKGFRRVEVDFVKSVVRLIE